MESSAKRCLVNEPMSQLNCNQWHTFASCPKATGDTGNQRERGRCSLSLAISIWPLNSGQKRITKASGSEHQESAGRSLSSLTSSSDAEMSHLVAMEHPDSSFYSMDSRGKQKRFRGFSLNESLKSLQEQTSTTFYFFVVTGIQWLNVSNKLSERFGQLQSGSGSFLSPTRLFSSLDRERPSRKVKRKHFRV